MKIEHMTKNEIQKLFNNFAFLVFYTSYFKYNNHDQPL
jgi:hypothetical protein